MTSPDRRPLVVVMGVSGSGKTTVGRALATALDVPFADAETPITTTSGLRSGDVMAPSSPSGCLGTGLAQAPATVHTGPIMFI